MSKFHPKTLLKAGFPSPGLFSVIKKHGNHDTSLACFLKNLPQDKGLVAQKIIVIIKLDIFLYYVYNVEMKFEWDESKNEINRKKHGIWFEEAQMIFSDPGHHVFLDTEHATNEDRYIVIGYSQSERLLVMIFCYRKREGFMKKEYNFSKMKDVKSPIKVKKSMNINLHHEVIDYFKSLSKKTNIPYQQLINFYLLDCVKNKKIISIKWISSNYKDKSMGWS